MDRDTPIQNIAFFGEAEAGPRSTRGPAKLLRQEHDNCCWRMTGDPDFAAKSTQASVEGYLVMKRVLMRSRANCSGKACTQRS